MPIPKNGLLYKCLTVFTLLLKPHEEQFNMTSSDAYHITLDMHPEEYFNTIELVQASVVIHDPRHGVNPLTEGITLTAGKLYELFPTMEIKESLPPPYASNCIDYLKLWKKNGGHGPLSKDDCINECKIKAMFAEYRCVGEEVTYPNTFPICVNDEEVLYEVNRFCTSSCRDACYEHSYHLTSDIIFDLESWCDATDEYCKNRVLGIHVRFNRMKVKKFKQIPRFESIELFSYIGGYLGLWLGISLATVFDIAEMIYDVIDKAFRKPKRKQKTTKPNEQFPHHSAVKKEKTTIQRRKMSL